MYARFILLLLCINLAISVRAQNLLQEEEIQSLSTQINDLQLGAESLIYTDELGNSSASFSQKHFRVLLSSGLANYAVYKTRNGKQQLEMAENIDFSKASSVNTLFWSESITVFRVEFDKPINISVYENGKFVQKSTRKHLDFYVRNHSNNSDIVSKQANWVFYDKIVTLCHLLKSKAGIFPKYDINKLTQSWNKAVDDHTLESFEKFLALYPNTLYQAQATVKIKLFNAKIARGKITNKKMDSLAATYGFKWGLTTEEFARFNPEAYALIKAKNDKYFTGTYTRYYSGIGSPWSPGPQSLTLGKNGPSAYELALKRERKNLKPLRDYCREWKLKLKALFPEATHIEADDVYIVTSPDGSRTIQIALIGREDWWAAVMIKFL